MFAQRTQQLILLGEFESSIGNVFSWLRAWGRILSATATAYRWLAGARERETYYMSLARKPTAFFSRVCQRTRTLARGRTVLQDCPLLHGSQKSEVLYVIFLTRN